MAGQDSHVLCSFCDGEFTSSEAMMEHLMMCGNKTDQCPNCGKYVRRAIFAYHYENGCANPDDLTTDDEKRPKSQYSNAVRITVTCPFCNQNHDKSDSKIHKANCSLNPKNVEQKNQQSTSENSNRSSDRSRQSNDSDDNALIPCEYCNKGITWLLYENHTKTCREEHQRKQKQSQHNSQERTPTTTTVSSTAMCVHCQTPRSMGGLAYHQLCCKMNPHRTGVR